MGIENEIEAGIEKAKAKPTKYLQWIIPAAVVAVMVLVGFAFFVLDLV